MEDDNLLGVTSIDFVLFTYHNLQAKCERYIHRF